MNMSKFNLIPAASLLFALVLFTGCASTDSDSANVVNNYYGAGYQDPWYHGDYHDGDVIVTPPPPGNPPDQGLRPTHPIASPPPRPSIPSTPRPSPRPAMRR
jgi:hypothetical protein